MPADESGTDVVLVRQDAAEAERTLRTRVYWLGVASVMVTLSGQGPAFWLSGRVYSGWV